MIGKVVDLKMRNCLWWRGERLAHEHPRADFEGEQCVARLPFLIVYAVLRTLDHVRF